MSNNILIQENSLKSLGNAIRHVNGKTTLYTPSQMADQINSWGTAIRPRIYLYNYANSTDPFCGIETGGWSIKGSRGYNSASDRPGAGGGGVMGSGRVLINRVFTTELTNNITQNVLDFNSYCSSSTPVMSMATFRALPVKQWLDAGYDTVKIKWAKQNDPNALGGTPLIQKPNKVKAQLLFSTQISMPNKATIGPALGIYGGVNEDSYTLYSTYRQDAMQVTSFDLFAMAENGLAVQDNLYFSMATNNLHTNQQQITEVNNLTASSYTNFYILTIYVCKGDEDTDV